MNLFFTKGKWGSRDNQENHENKRRLQKETMTLGAKEEPKNEHVENKNEMKQSEDLRTKCSKNGVFRTGV